MSGVRKPIFKNPRVGLYPACKMGGASVHHGNQQREAEGIQVSAGDSRLPVLRARAQDTRGNIWDLNK